MSTFLIRLTHIPNNTCVFQTITVLNAELDLDTDPYCDRDYLEILDGDEAMDHSFGRYH